MCLQRYTILVQEWIDCYYTGLAIFRNKGRLNNKLMLKRNVCGGLCHNKEQRAYGGIWQCISAEAGH
jgi:hypothetical protein